MVAPFYVSPSGSALRVADYEVTGVRSADDQFTFSSPLSRVVTEELVEAGTSLGLGSEEILLAALCGAIARTIGVGVVHVDVTGTGGSVYPVSLRCENDGGDRATETLVAVHRALVTASLLGADDVRSRADVAFAYLGDDAPASTEMAPEHALELVAYHLDGLLELDWRYDARQFDSYTIEELSEQLPLALIALTSEAIAPIDAVALPPSRIFAAK